MRFAWQPWTFGQRVALLTILAGLLVYLSVRYFRDRAYVPDPMPLESPRAFELADRIDPNSADEKELGALPTLGEKRAKLIVDYREWFAKNFTHAGRAFQRPEDLLKIKGIGVSTVDQLRPFLTFPTTQPMTQPTTQPATRQ